MYSNMNYPTQLLISSLNKKEKLILAKELENNFNQTTEKEYVTQAYQLKFVLKPKDASLLKSKIADAETTDIKMKLCWIGVTVFAFFLVYMFKKAR